MHHTRPIRFVCDVRQTRVVFGAGALDGVPAELARAGLHRAFLVSTPGRSADAGRLGAALGATCVGAYDAARLHVPAATVGRAMAEIERLTPDCCISIGGGSAIGLGKAIALQAALPLVSIPTTYSGSEMTDAWGVTADGVKRTGRDPRVAPAIVVYDAALTLGLPPDVSAASGMNAVAHAVESLYAPDQSPLASLLAADALRQLAAALPRVVLAPADIDARERAFLGAHFAGMALGLTTMGLHHKICHVLGGSFGLPHALTHAVLLPHVVAFNTGAAPAAMQVIANVLQSRDAAAALLQLNRRIGLPASLRDAGLRDEDVVAAADLVMQATYPNPRPVTREGVVAILRNASAGAEPAHA